MESPPIDDCGFILTVHVSPYISNTHNSVSEISRTRSELINLWNKLTDYYLPYEGDKEFTEIVVFPP